jgi:hypothetical protein
MENGTSAKGGQVEVILKVLSGLIKFIWVVSNWRTMI